MSTETSDKDRVADAVISQNSNPRPIVKHIHEQMLAQGRVLHEDATAIQPSVLDGAPRPNASRKAKLKKEF